jgi:hypothetical protein
MNIAEFEKLVSEIVRDATELKDVHTDQQGISVGYACIFSQSEEEYRKLVAVAEEIGRVIEDTKMGPVFLVSPLETVAGVLRIIKVRKPDPTRKERGDADFNVTDYPDFKERYLNLPGFSLIEREKAEMIELIAPDANVRCYFSNPPAEKQFGL